MPFQPSKWHFEIDDYIKPWLPTVPWKRVPYPIAHFMGRRPQPQRPIGNIAMIFWAFIGIFCALIAVESVGRVIPSFKEHEVPIIIPSFGAAAVLEFYAIDSPLAQPRNAVLGQFFASIIGVTISKLFAMGSVSKDLAWIGGPLSCATAVAFMALTGTVHPPAGATALLAVIEPKVVHLGWFLLPVILFTCLLIQSVALFVNNIQRRYPLYWWTPAEVGYRKKHQQQQDEKNNSDSSRETGAKLEITTRHMEEGKVGKEEIQIIIRRGQVFIPADICVSPEDKTYLEALSEKL